MNTDSDGGPAFDALLERELRRRLGALRGPSAGLDRAAYRAVANGGRTMPLLSSVAAAASSKAAAGLAAAALVVGGGTAAAAAASHSANPGAFSRSISEAVEACKSKLASGQHGIGDCVSAAAKHHGQERRAEHANDAAGDVPNGAPSPHPTGKPATHPNGKSSSHDGGKPSDVPASPPAADGDHRNGPPASPGSHQPTPHQ